MDFQQVENEPVASMGPRHFSRGIYHQLLHGTSKPTLQWGRGISAAELCSSTYGCWLPEKLQWGRGISAAELRGPSLRCWPSCRFNGAAAFQPRNLRECWEGQSWQPSFNGAAAFQPRNFGRQAWVRRLPNASMGPRHFSRGIVCVHPISVRWVLKLQWGRGISAAEFSPLAAGKRCLSCFNGAAAFQPRNCSASGSGLREDRKASMGPRHFSRGITPSPSSNQMDPASFNGAAAFQPRNFEHR